MGFFAGNENCGIYSIWLEGFVASKKIRNGKQYKDQSNNAIALQQADWICKQEIFFFFKEAKIISILGFHSSFPQEI